MTIPVQVGTTPATPAGTTTAAPRRNDEIDKEAFLQLLVAQLRYQDPLSPTDPGQFMAQTAQLTSIEKLDLIAQQSAATVSALGLSAATGLIGRTVTWQGTDGADHSGAVTRARSTLDGVVVDVGGEQIPLDRITGIG